MISQINKNVSFIYYGPHKIESTQAEYKLQPFTIKQVEIITDKKEKRIKKK